MLKRMLKYTACVVGPAAISAIIPATTSTIGLFGGLAGQAAWTFFASKLILMYAAYLPAHMVLSALILGAALLIRRTQLVHVSFIAASVLVALINAVFLYLTLPNFGTGILHFLAALVTSAIFVGLQSVALALIHRWLFDSRSPPSPDKAF